MKYFLLVLIQFLIASPVMAFDVRVQGIDDSCSEGTQFDVCPKAYRQVVSQVMPKSLYNMVIGQKIMEVCISSLASYKIPAERAERNLALKLDQSFYVDPQSLDACMRQEAVNFKSQKRDRADTNKVLSSYLHVVNKNILDSQKNQLSEMAEIDRILGLKPLSDLSCTGESAGDCNKVKACQQAPETIDSIAEFTVMALNEQKKLEKQLSDISRERIVISKSSSDPDTYYKLFKDIKNRIHAIDEMLPWMKGDVAKGSLSSIKQNLRQDKQELAMSQMKLALTNQFVKTRSIIKNNYLDASVDHGCLKNNVGCTDKVVERLNKHVTRDYSKYSLDPEKITAPREKFSDDLETQLLLQAGHCVATQMKAKEEVDESIKLVGTTLVGLGIGGVGGVAKLAQIGLRTFQGGNKLHGAAAIGLLGVEAKMFSDSLESAVSGCKESINRIVRSAEASDNVCQANAKNTYKLADIKSCVVNLTLTTLPYALSVRLKSRGQMAPPSNQLTETMHQEKKIHDLLKNPHLALNEKDEISKALAKLDLPEKELEDALHNLNTLVKNNKDKNQAKNFINYLATFGKKDQKEAITQLKNVITISEEGTSGYAQKFLKSDVKFTKYETMVLNSNANKLMKQGRTKKEAFEEAGVIAKAQRTKLQEKYYSCRSRSLTPDHAVAAKRFAGFSLAMGIGGTTYGYTKANSEKFEGNETQWFGKLGYDLAMTYLLTKLSVSIQKNPSGTFTQRYVASNVGSAALGVIDAGVYSQLYGVSEEEAARKVEEILRSPEARKELKILDAFLEKENVVQKFQDSLIESYKKLAANSKQDAQSSEAEPTFLANLTDEELQKPETRQKILEAVMHQMNSGDASGILSTGDLGADRWVNDRAWNAMVGIPKGIVTGYAIFQVLCIGADQPLLSFGTAAGIQFANQFISGEQYYKFRREMIGQ